MGVVRIQPELFDPGAESAAVGHGRPEVGAVASFTGLCRADDNLNALVLEHYPGMTERAMRDIVAEAERRWPILDCLVIHRYGRILPGEPIVLVTMASGHRSDAFDACSFVMDWLKTRAPFWKLEEFPDGQTRWVEAKQADDDAADRWQGTA
ncbi:molybdenum cofactor biosynthesis protein MoaE [Pseudoroseomonas globiformis]|uniref:Molybdopterin synthase catalytic subunit n=1 Tax=Teichococcus globiformis TaxID=2307229 RepID=A0ABV7G317_9PROT